MLMAIRSFVFVAVLAIGSCVTAQTPLSLKPSIQLDDSAKRILFERAVRLKPGDPLSRVINDLGKPTYDQRLVAKESSRLVCHALKYYAVKWDTGVNETLDELVDVCLDRE